MRRSLKKWSDLSVLGWGASLALTLLVSLGPFASDGRVPVYEATTITAPGSYYLTRDLAAGNLVIQASDVTLDLNGFTVAGEVQVTAAAPLFRVWVHGGRCSGALYVYSVTDLTVRRLDAGAIKLNYASRFAVEECNTDHFEVNYCQGGKIQDCSTSGQYGIHLYQSHVCQILRNMLIGATTPTSYGVYLQGSWGNLVEGNTISTYDGQGVYCFFGSESTLKDNVVRDNDGGGILLDNSGLCRVTGNTVVKNGTGTGIKAEDSPQGEITHNEVVNPQGGSGIHLNSTSSSYNVSHNTVLLSGCATCAGILIESANNAVDWNVVLNNSAHNIWLSGPSATGNFLSHNRAQLDYVWGTGNTDVAYGSGYRTNF